MVNYDQKMSGIAIVIGTKAELIKCMPLMLELQKQKKSYWFIHTGQHSLEKATEEFGVKRPDFILSKEPERSTKFWSKINRNSLIWFFGTILRIKRAIKIIRPKYVIYHGDTMSTAAASIASSKMLNPGKRWENVHLEAGLRSGSIFEPFPEEISRKISDNFSDILLAVSDLTEDNLRREKLKGKILRIGNTIVDSAAIIYQKARKEHKRAGYRYALINIHRHENLKSKDRMERIIDILRAVKINAMWPIHANTAHFIESYGMVGEVKNLKNIEIMPLKSYEEFIFLLANCDYLITDGGSIQEESLVFKKPCVILRKRTERQEGLKTGINFLTKLDSSYSNRVIKDIEDKKMKTEKFVNPYGEVGVSSKIVKILA